MGHERGLSRQRYHILLALSGEDLHGSGIVRAVLAQTDGALHLWPATLYGSLETLVADGLIEELGSEQRPDGESERRRYYRITEAGKHTLGRETELLARWVSTARRNLGHETS